MMAPSRRPTRRQQQVLDFVADFARRQGMPPTVREIAAGLGIASTNAVAGHIAALRRKGLLEKLPGKSRGLKVPDQGARNQRLVPVLGRIAAGRPIHAEENLEGHIVADPFMVREPDDTFVLKVEGDSMNGDGILPGDYIFVRRQPVAHNGEIVVALIEDEATVKRYFQDDEGTIRLEASNPAYPDMAFHGDDGTRFEILGIMTGLYRRR